MVRGSMVSLARFTRSLVVLAALFAAACDEPSSTPGGDAGVACDPGSIGCICARGDVCGTTSNGEALACVQGTCVSQRCPPGATGCVCRAGTSCDVAGDACSNGICKPESCIAGEASCDCLAGSCGAGLYCDRTLGGGTCVDGTGHPGGACPGNGLCIGQNRCDRDTLTCVYCEAGSQGCVPSATGCNSGLVAAAGRCVPPTELRPADPQCFTRCQPNTGVGVSAVACGPDGFIEGCVDGFQCVDGSCVRAGQTPRSCRADAECPSFQTCAETVGRCYSNCDGSTPCPMGLTCDDHVCRVPCARPNTSNDSCPSDSFCDMRDGVSGVCMPIVDRSAGTEASTHVRATFELAPSAIELTDVRWSGTTRVSTDSPLDETFDVRTLEHRAYASDGSLLEERRRADGQVPLPFLEVRTSQGAAAGGVTTLRVPARCGTSCPTLTVATTSAAALPAGTTRWEGTVEVNHPELGAQLLHVTHVSGAAWRWVGKMHYFASFPDVGIENLRGPDKSRASDVRNALIQRWAAFREGNLDGGFDEMKAVLDATRTESWRSPSVMQACTGSTSGAGECGPACYLYDDGQTVGTGVRRYVSSQCDSPVPTGATEYPIALDLHADAAAMGGGYAMVGTIDSAVALHYGGYPTIRMRFDSSPTSPSRCAPGGECVTFVTDVSAHATIGGRTNRTSVPTCPSGFAETPFPWLIPGFLSGTNTGETDGRLYQTDCRDTRMPYVGQTALDANLTGGNPIPDGRALRRELLLLDGALVDQDTLFVLFEERFASSLDPAGFSTYGYMLLARSEQFSGSLVPGTTDHDAADKPGLPTLGPVCDGDLLRDVFGAATTVTPSNARAVATAMIAGTATSPDSLAKYDLSQVHYLCVDTGRFDGGAGDRGGANDLALECPVQSNVRFFAYPNDPVPNTRGAFLADQPCQRDGTCGAVLDAWLSSNAVIDADPVWMCTGTGGSPDPNVAFCSDDRTDLRAKKVFYKPRPSGTAQVLGPLVPRIQEAFRYKTRFQSADARTLGFTPALCQGDGASTPYCYDASAIEEIASRLDCLMYVYDTYSTGPGDTQYSDVRTLLSTSLGRHPSTDWNAPLVDGFERLNAELLVMLGDESYTRALSSRFDLASSHGATFLGSRFEVGGPDLSGLAGYEMHSLYQAAQYYELAEDRFYRVIAPVLYKALSSTRHDVGIDGVAVVSPSLVTAYLERLIGGSTKKARTWSEIARRYQGFHRPDLARRVLERAYTSTYLESVVLSQLMLQIADGFDSRYRNDVVAVIEKAQHTYRVALDDMREVYSTISDDVNIFGFSPDEIPFPAVDDADTRYSNAFEAVLAIARQRTDTARRFEDEALSSSRAFDTDAASFQAELVRIGLTYEHRLNELCGSFVGRDGLVHPATSTYASLSERTSTMQDPCGLLDNGEIHEALMELILQADDQRALDRQLSNLEAQIAGERQRVADRCGLVQEIADFQYQQGTQVKSLNDQIRATRTVISGLDRTTNLILGIAGADTFSKLAAVAAIGTSLSATALEGSVAAAESRIEQTQLETARWVTTRQCRELEIDSNFTTANLLRDAQQLETQGLRLLHQFALAQSRIERLRLEARRVEEEQHRSEQLVVDAEAARNDPNIRIYQNASVMNADRSFRRALEHAYRATRMFEYFTSQSYPKKDTLFLIRMVSHDVYNIDTYLDELEDDYEAFRAQYRTRSNRVKRISLRDDVLLVGRNDAMGALDDTRRIALFRERLADARMLDAQGRLTVPFRTFRSQLSPCTFNHQINHVEVLFTGRTLGDLEAEVWIRQDGTGSIETVAHDSVSYKMPAALSVARPYLGSIVPYYDPSVYRQYEFRERPVVNSSWSLVFDQRNNPDNQDIDLQALNDIVLFVYYTDFTDPSVCR